MYENVITIIYIFSATWCAQGKLFKYNEKILEEKYGPVVFANMLYRHGDRTIQQSYPKDPHANSTHWKIGLGELTEEGQARQFLLGKWIRQKYNHLLSEFYSVNDIYVASSITDRCLMSAQCTLAGLYSKKNESILPFQPVPIHTKSEEEDSMIHMSAPCAYYDFETKKLETTLKRDWNRRLQELYTNLTVLTGKKIDNADSIGQIYDTLKIEKYQFNLALPDWADDTLLKKLLNIAVKAMLIHTHTLEMKKLKAGPILSDMLSHLVYKANGTLNPDRKLWMYSGHDETIVAVLHALDVHHYPITIPSYSSLFVMELRKESNKEHYVTMKYKEGANDTAVELRLDGCGEVACTLEQFLQLTHELRIENWIQDCSIPSNFIHSVNRDKYMKFGWVLTGFILISAGLSIWYYKPKKVTKYSKLKSELY